MLKKKKKKLHPQKKKITVPEEKKNQRGIGNSELYICKSVNYAHCVTQAKLLDVSLNLNLLIDKSRSKYGYWHLFSNM